VQKALIANGHEVDIFDFKRGYTKLRSVLKNYDVIFPVMHGKEGEDGTLYQFLSSSKKPYVGSEPKGARIAFNKIFFKKYSDSKNILSSPWKIVKTQRDIIRFGFPCVLKATYGGSSHEVVLLRRQSDLHNARVKQILTLEGGCYVERLLTGTEITVGVLQGKALPVIEIIPPEAGWFDYKNKYSGKSKEVPFAPSVSEKNQKKVQAIALSIHKELKLGSYSRTDFIVQNNVPYILEINTPGGVGLTSESLLPKAAKAVGINFKQLVQKMLINSDHR
jgi:D-alanine-D-alanine ligase